MIEPFGIFCQDDRGGTWWTTEQGVVWYTHYECIANATVRNMRHNWNQVLPLSEAPFPYSVKIIGTDGEPQDV